MHDVRHKLLEGSAGGLTVQRTQEIPQSFLDSLAAEKLASKAPAGDFHRFASIPVVVVEKWAREGFDIIKNKYSAREIMARLSREDLGAFITTNKVL